MWVTALTVTGIMTQPTRLVTTGTVTMSATDNIIIVISNNITTVLATGYSNGHSSAMAISSLTDGSVGSARGFAAVHGSAPYPDNLSTRVTLPIAPILGQGAVIKDGTGLAASHAITISGGTIDGAGSFAISANYASVSLIYTGSGNWSVI
jgi:hypothetical protein